MIFNITFTPQFREGITAFEKEESKFKINGQVFDFEGMPINARLPYGAIDSDLIVGDVVSNDDGDISFKVIYSSSEGSEEFNLQVSKNGVIDDDRLVTTKNVGAVATGEE